MNSKNILQVKNLTVEVAGRIILENVSLKIGRGEVHALIGPNGEGKSTLLMALMKHFAYKIQKGSVIFDGQNTENLEVNEISKLGMFLAFQSPFAIHGLKTIDFVKAIINSHLDKPVSPLVYYNQIQTNMKKLSLDKGILEREVNVNFSGGEKKKNELLQMLMLDNKLVLLDEIDSGLDVDNINEIIRIVTEHHKSTETSYLIVSHYDKLFLTLNVDYTHLIYNKQLITSKGDTLIKEVHKWGYQTVIEKLGMKLKVDNNKQNNQTKKIVLGSCAVKRS